MFNRRAKAKTKIRIKKEVFEKIIATLGSQIPEQGGYTIADIEGDKATINDFIYDFSANTSAAAYSPDTAIMSPKIGKAIASDKYCQGIVHSHPDGCPYYSDADEEYAKRIIDAYYIPFFDVGVGQRRKGDSLDIRFFRVYPRKSHKKTEEVLYEVAEDYETELKPKVKSDHERVTSHKYDRIEQAIDMDVMKNKTIVALGSGGALLYYVDMARCGVSKYVVFDHDYYQDTNIANQYAEISNLGKGKVEVAKEKIHDVNPSASVKAIQRRLDDSISDEEFVSLVGKGILKHPEDYLIAAFTDDFYAQARAAALAVKFGTPFISAQMYKNGDAAEVFFSYPGVTASCHRCATESRYQAYRHGFNNNVTSSCSTIFSTGRVNAICGQISLMLLQYGCERGRYGKILERVADRNFIQINITPFDNVIKNDIFDDAFDKEFAFCDSTVWIPQEPNDNCPLCGGEGNLLKSKDRIKDTRRDLI